MGAGVPRAGDNKFFFFTSSTQHTPVSFNTRNCLVTLYRLIYSHIVAAHSPPTTSSSSSSAYGSCARGAALPALTSPPPHCRAAPRAASPGVLRALVRARSARALPVRSAHVSPIVPTRPRARAAPATRGASHQRQVHGIARPARSGQKSAEGKRGCGGGADAHLNDLLDAARRRKGLVSRAVQLELALYGT